MALTQCHYRCNTVLMLSLACTLKTHTHTDIHTKAVSLRKLMGCVPRKTWILKSWLGAEHRWRVCVFERKRETDICEFCCLFLLMFIYRLSHEASSHARVCW